MNQCKQLPLRVYLSSASKRESVQAVGVQVAKHRFDVAEPPAIPPPAFAAVDSDLHGRGLWVRVLGLAAAEERHLSIDADLGLTNVRAALRALTADRVTGLDAKTISSAFAACTDSGCLQPALNRT